MNPEDLARLRNHVREWFAAKRRYEAAHPPIRLAINWDEVAEIDALLDASARDPDEWA